MPQPPLSNRAALLVVTPLPDGEALYHFVPGQKIILNFAMAGARVSRHADNLVFALHEGAAVTIADFFANDQSLPSLTLHDGTWVTADDFFEQFNPALHTAGTPDSPENTPSEEETKLDELLEGVGRMGGMGSLYWGDGLTEVTEEEDLFLREEGGFGLNPPVQQNMRAHDSSGQSLTGASTPSGNHKPGYEHRDEIPLPGRDDGWVISGSMGTYRDAAGRETPGLASSAGGGNPFADRGFDIDNFIRENTSLEGWTKDGNGFGCAMRETSVADDAVDPRIELKWSMMADGSKGAPNASDVTIALLFKIGPDGRLIYLDHKILEFSGLDENGMPAAASGGVSWAVEPGERYVTSFVVVGADPDGDCGTVLLVDGMEHVYQTAPVWEEPEDDAGANLLPAVLGEASDDPPEREDVGARGTAQETDRDNDIFSRNEDGCNGVVTLAEYSLFADNGRLHLEDLLDEGEDLGQLLALNKITLSGENDTVRLDISTENSGRLLVDVTLPEGELQSFRAEYGEKTGTAENLEQALLQMMLFGS